jgi:hypothetical protein
LCHDEIVIILESDSDAYSEEENELYKIQQDHPQTSRNMKMKLKKKKSSINRKDDDNNNHRSSDYSQP